jgi:serine-type anaerobic sulfatase-maturating enzyme
MAKKTQNKKKLRRQARRETFARSPRPAPEPETQKQPERWRFCIMAKPIGPACNLRCTYCFYLEKEALLDNGDHRMSDEVLEAYVRKYFQSQPGSEPVAFHWQGGEPTLMGLDFYRKVIELERKHCHGRAFTNSIQTNGTLFDDEWGRFLSEGKWLVGLSLDGPKEVHDTYRLDTHGKGSFDAVMLGLDVLKRYNVEFNVLTSVTPATTAHPLEVYRFFKDVGVRFVQFMPIVERLPDHAAEELGLQLAVGIRSGEAVQTVKMTPWSVVPEAYGEFLVGIFNEWVRNDVGSLTVMNFEWAFANYLGRPAGVCGWMPTCGRSPIIEHNGDVYACDHYMYPEYRLGNVLSDDLQEMMQSKRQVAFGDAKLDTLPKYCRQCSVGPACWGECPKRRFLETPDGEPGLNYLCVGYKKFFEHSAPYFHAMARLMEEGQPASKIMESQVFLMPRGFRDPKGHR